MKKALGGFLVSLPFIALISAMTIGYGLLFTLISCVAVAVVTLLIIVGVMLLMGEL